MSHRTQVVLTDEQYATLQQVSQQSGLGLGELVRRVVARAYGSGTADEAEEILARTAGAWRGRSFDGASYVEMMRTGMAARLQR